MIPYITDLLSRVKNISSEEPLNSSYSFHYASTIGELLTIMENYEGINQKTLDEINSQLDHTKLKFEDQLFISALKAGIQEIIDAHHQKIINIGSLIEFDGFFEIEMILTGRDRLEFTSEVIKYFGDNKELRKTIEGYSNLDRILKLNINKIFSKYKNDFLAEPPSHWFPKTFWWRPYWSCMDLNLT